MHSAGHFPASLTLNFPPAANSQPELACSDASPTRSDGAQSWSGSLSASENFWRAPYSAWPDVEARNRHVSAGEVIHRNFR